MIYGNPKAAPQVSFPEAAGTRRLETKVGSTRGGMDGSVVEPTNENIATKK